MPSNGFREERYVKTIAVSSPITGIFVFFSSARFKALYMYEIGRMMQFFDDPSQLKLTLTLSEMTEMFQIDPYYCREEVNQQILRQTTLLKANLCDQG